jgi:hypothetical protein
MDEELPGDCKWRNNLIPNLHCLDCASYFFDNTCEFVTHDKTRGTGLVAPKDMQFPVQ